MAISILMAILVTIANLKTDLDTAIHWFYKLNIDCNEVLIGMATVERKE